MDEWFPRKIKTLAQVGVKLADKWEPFEVISDPSQPNMEPGDITLLMGLIALSSRAVGVLRDLIEPYGEFLPLYGPTDYTVFNHTAVIQNVLDIQHSDIQWLRDPGGSIFQIDRYALHQEAIPSVPIFCLAEYKKQILVNNDFANRVLEAKLTGFQFKEVWSTEHGGIQRPDPFKVD